MDVCAGCPKYQFVQQVHLLIEVSLSSGVVIKKFILKSYLRGSVVG
jgi:hypothetical protein